MFRYISIVLCIFLVIPFQVFAEENIADSLVTTAVAPKIFFSEIMANPFDESTGEFIEIYNPGDEAVDVAGWTLSDLVDTKDTLKDYTGSFDLGASGTLIAPHSFALIVDADYAGQYNALVTAHADLTSLIIITVDDASLGNGLGNSSDTLNVVSADTLYQVSHSWASDTGNGISWSGFGLGTPSESWKKSGQTEGATPGFSNNMPPQAALLKTHEEGISPLAVSFEASESTDPEGLPLNFSMDYGDGESASFQTTAAFSHIYPEVGLYTATLTVQDSEGATSQAQETITVAPRAEIIPCTLAITEVLPNPTGDDTTDEFIEIQNRGSSPCDLAKYSLDDADGGSSPFVLPATSLGAGAYTAFYASTTHITLNNTGDSARILSNTSSIVSEVSYTDSKEGESFASNESLFVWTTTPTPNAANVFTEAATPPDTEDPTPPNPEAEDPLPLSTIRDAKKLEANDDVMVEGYVIARPGTLSSQYLYIHDATTGIQIYSSKKLFPKVKLGQKVRVTGVISKTTSLTRILIHEASDVEVLPGLQSIKALSKKTGKLVSSDEGELVVVSGKIEKKAGTSALINDGSGSLIIAFRDGSGLKTSSVTTGDTTTIQGIVTISNDQVEILPRETTDLLKTSSIRTASATSGTLPKAGVDATAVLLSSFGLSVVSFAIFQVFRERSSKTLLSASTKNSGKNFGGTISLFPERNFTSLGETLPTKRF
jgi:uncharacterized protein YdeI (BOF family)